MKDSWYDWTCFKLDGYEQSTPTRIMMIIDLIDAEILYECESDTDGENSSRAVQPIRHLTKEKWVVVLAAEGHEASNEDLTDKHFDFTTHTRIKLYSNNDMWMIPLIYLVEPCFVIYKKITVSKICKIDMLMIERHMLLIR